MRPIHVLSAALVLTLAGCASTPATTSRTTVDAPPMRGMATTSSVMNASVALASASGSLVSGKLTAMPMGDGVHFRGEIGGLAPNSTHAIHIHQKGDCSAADATSAGDHFNPAMRAHGKPGTAVHHVGDLLNIVANSDGVARVDAHAQGVVLGGGAANDALGRAVIVHAAADDYTSQPAGNAGSRVACGVIASR